MLFSKFFPVAMVLPALAIAGSSASPSNHEISQLLERQTSSLTTILSDLTSSLGAIEQLLSADSLNNIEAVVTDLADLFAAPTMNQTKSLINTASSLLDSPAITGIIADIPDLLSSVSGILTPALITNVTDLIGAVHIVLTPAVATEVANLVTEFGPIIDAISQVISTLLSSLLG